jgi:predicted transcriptional regulator
MVSMTKQKSIKASAAASKKLRGQSSLKNRRRVDEILKIPPEKRTKLQEQLLSSSPRWKVICPHCNNSLGEYIYKKDIPVKLVCGITPQCKWFWAKGRTFKIHGTIVTDSGTADVTKESKSVTKIEFNDKDKGMIVRMTSLGMTRGEICDVIGVSETCFNNLMKADYKLMDRCLAARSKIKFRLIDKAFTMAENGNPALLRFLLRTKYGFTTVDNQDDDSVIRFNKSGNNIDYSKLSTEELKTLKSIFYKCSDKESSGSGIIDVEVENQNEKT